jgi:hypothetical protein
MSGGNRKRLRFARASLLWFLLPGAIPSSTAVYFPRTPPSRKKVGPAAPEPAPPNPGKDKPDPGKSKPKRSPKYIRWSDLLRRVFGIDHLPDMPDSAAPDLPDQELNHRQEDPGRHAPACGR